MLDVVRGTIVGGNFHRAGLFVNEKEIAAKSVSDCQEALLWAAETWKKRKAEVGCAECRRLGWDVAELRYWH